MYAAIISCVAFFWGGGVLRVQSDCKTFLGDKKKKLSTPPHALEYLQLFAVDSLRPRYYLRVAKKLQNCSFLSGSGEFSVIQRRF